MNLVAVTKLDSTKICVMYIEKTGSSQYVWGNGWSLSCLSLYFHQFKEPFNCLLFNLCCITVDGNGRSWNRSRLETTHHPVQDWATASLSLAIRYFLIGNGYYISGERYPIISNNVFIDSYLIFYGSKESCHWNYGVCIYTVCFFSLS